MTENVVITASIQIDGQPYRIVRYRLEEALFDVGGVSCGIVQEDDQAAAPAPAALLGKRAVVTIERTDGRRRLFAGHVIEATRANSDESVDAVALRIAPDLWRLGKRADCRVFQKLSVPDIVKQVLEGGGVPAARQDWRTTGNYPARTYVAQYRETDLDFVMRLLSEEGIYFAVHHEDDGDRVVFGDDPAGLGPIEGTSCLPFREVYGFHVVEDAVMRVEQTLEIRPDKVVLRDYNPDKPKLKLDTQAQGTDDGPHSLEVYDYPGRFQEKTVGDRLAKVLLRSMQAERNVVRGETGSLTLRPGLTFTIEQHPYGPLNQQYLVTGIVIEGYGPPRFRAPPEKREAGYGCRFTSIPTKTSPYAPPRRARARAIPGLQTALTTGPSGQEIYTNEQGQVKAQFHWDRLGKRDENASRWMRTSQLPTGGSMLLPRMNWEVSVRYVEGDGDQPVVMARLYNGATPPPYALPANKARSSIQTATTPGGGSSNELRLDDTGGKEEMFFNASKDMSIDVVNNTTESVGNNQTRTVGSNHSLEITNSFSADVGADQTVGVDGDQTLNVQTMMIDTIGGSQTLSIGGNRDMKVGGDHKRDVASDSRLTVNSSMIDLVIGAVTDHTLGDYKHEVGAAFVEMTPQNRSLSVAGSMTETTAAVKIKGALGDVGVQVGSSLNHKVAGAIVNSVTGDRVESAKTNFTEITAGAHVVKAKLVTYEAEAALTLVMGGSIVTLTPASITVLGSSIKLDGAVSDGGALVSDN
ncbi:MAG: type VI secretion system tip protein TssI/VgrG [Polyangiaceae bacterium]